MNNHFEVVGMLIHFIGLVVSIGAFVGYICLTEPDLEDYGFSDKELLMMFLIGSLISFFFWSLAVDVGRWL